jgi:hypothetical protein
VSDARRLRLSEALVGGATLAVALTAWAALALAHAGLFSGPAVAAATALVLAGLLVGLRRARVVADPGALLGLAVLAALTALLFLPGWRYTVGDKDPGAYVSHAVSIARTGDAAVDDVLRQRVPRVQLSAPGSRFPGVEVRASDGATVPSFYHLWPALLAVAYTAGGGAALADLTPVLGVLAVLVVTVAVRRAVSPVAAALSGVLLACNELEVWQVKYPTTETLAQLLTSGALLAVVLALDLTGSTATASAAAAGGLVGAGWLVRADGLLLVALSLAACCALWVTGRWDRRCTAFALGLLAVVPHASWQAWWYARHYTLVNGVPDGTTVLAGTLAVVAAAAVARRLLGRRLQHRLPLSARDQSRVGLAVVAVVVAGLALGFLRPRLFGADYQHYTGPVVRSYDEQALRRLSWFLTLPALALMVGGVALVALPRWRAAAWALVLPGLVLMPLYCWSAHNSSRLMWWGRRFVPVVLAAVIILVAVALARGLRSRLLRPAAAVLAVYLLATFLHQSLPLRRHEEFAGAQAVVRQLAQVTRGGVLLWEPGRCCTSATRLFALPVWLQEGVPSSPLATLPRLRPQYVQQVARAFPDRPLFVAWSGTALPQDVGPVRLEAVAHVVAQLRVWQESDVVRPDSAVSVPVDVTVWRVQTTAVTASSTRSTSPSVNPLPDGSTSPRAATSRQPGSERCAGSRA